MTILVLKRFHCIHFDPISRLFHWVLNRVWHEKFNERNNRMSIKSVKNYMHVFHSIPQLLIHWTELLWKLKSSWNIKDMVMEFGTAFFCIFPFIVAFVFFSVFLNHSFIITSTNDWSLWSTYICDVNIFLLCSMNVMGFVGDMWSKIVLANEKSK